MHPAPTGVTSSCPSGARIVGKGIAVALICGVVSWGERPGVQLGPAPVQPRGRCPAAPPSELTRPQIHVTLTTWMHNTDMGRRYRAEHREAQAAATRDLLLDTALRLLRHTRPVDLAYARIALEAGVSVRTLYRHFPKSDDLFLALSDRLMASVGVEPAAPLPDIATAMATVRRSFELLEADPALFRVFFAVPTRSRAGGAASMERLLAPYVAHLSADGQRAVAAVIDLMVSPYAWDVLHANWGADADLAYRAITAGIRAILELVLRDPRAFEQLSTLPEPP